jgi:hypothetical protein
MYFYIISYLDSARFHFLAHFYLRERVTACRHTGDAHENEQTKKRPVSSIQQCTGRVANEPTSTGKGTQIKEFRTVGIELRARRLNGCKGREDLSDITATLLSFLPPL